MESLLQWSLSNSTPSNPDAPPPQRQHLDPAIIDAILGKSDADLMKEDMSIIMDETASEDDRSGALDHFEMLVEQIDNANNMEKLGLWTPLHSLLSSSSKTPESVILNTIWVMGTALQNNPEAQDSYMKLSPIPTLLQFLSPSSRNPKIRSKALYALSGLLKHNVPAVQALEGEGWETLKGALLDPDITVRRKTIFLLSTLLYPSTPIAPPAPLPSSVHTPSTQPETIHANSHAANLRSPERAATSTLTLAAVQKHGIVASVVQGLVKPVPYGEDGDEEGGDVDYEEKCVAFLRTYVVECKASLTDEEKVAFRTWLESQGGAEKIGLGVGDLSELLDALR